MGVILEAVIRNGYSAQCVAFGMGGGLLQSQTRDTMKAAIKVCQIRVGGKNIPIMKAPKTDGSKNSLPGNMQVNIVDNAPMIYSRTSSPGWEDRRIENDMLQVIWDSGPTSWVPETFEQMRARLNREWSIRPLKTEILSNQMKALIEKTMGEIRSRI